MKPMHVPLTEPIYSRRSQLDPEGVADKWYQIQRPATEDMLDPVWSSETNFDETY